MKLIDIEMILLENECTDKGNMYKNDRSPHCTVQCYLASASSFILFLLLGRVTTVS